MKLSIILNNQEGEIILYDIFIVQNLRRACYRAYTSDIIIVKDHYKSQSKKVRI